MSNFLPNTGGGSSYGLGPPQNEFANAAARDAYANSNAAWLAEYNAHRFFWIRVGTNIQRRNAGGTAWENVTAVVQGRTGAKGDPGDDAQVNAGNVDPIIAAYTGAVPGLTIADAQIPASIMRDAELTAAAVRNLLGLTAQEVNDLVTGGTINGRVITLTQNDGSTIVLTVPAEAGGMADGVITGGFFSANGETLTLTLSVGGPIVISVPAILRGGAATHPDAYIAWSADTSFTAAEFKAGTSVENAQQGAIPTQSGFAYLALWLEGDHWDDIRQIDIGHGPNGLTDLEAAADLAIDGTTGKYRRYTTRISGDVAGGEVLRWQ